MSNNILLAFLYGWGFGISVGLLIRWLEARLIRRRLRNKGWKEDERNKQLYWRSLMDETHRHGHHLDECECPYDPDKSCWDQDYHGG